MTKNPVLSRLCPKEPPVTALLDLRDSSELSNRQPGAHGWLCSCAVDLESQCEEFSGWGEHPTGSTANYHCIATTSSTVLPPSGSDHAPVNSSHKQPQVSGIAKNDSKSSLKSFLFEVHDIPFRFPHWEDGDTSQYIARYNESHTYPTLQRRIKSGSGAAGSPIPLCSSCTHRKGGSQTSANLIKPKLVVLGEVSHQLYAAFPKPFRRRITSYKHSSEVKNQAEFSGVTKCAPVYRYEHQPSLQRSTSATLVGDKNEAAKDRATQKHDSARTRNYSSLSSSAAFATERSTENKEPVMNVKWTSRSFPSFMVSSMNTSTAPQTQTQDSQSIRKRATGNRDRFGTQKTKGLNPHQIQEHRAANNSKAFHSFGTRSMPAISSGGMATKNEFGHLLRHQTQVRFGSSVSSRPGFRYETLCLQGHNAVKNSPPVTIVGPWITTN